MPKGNKGGAKNPERQERRRWLILLHFNIVIFSLTNIFSTLAADNKNAAGLFDGHTMLYVGLMLLSCGVYAIFWQQDLKHLEVNVAYAHRSVYCVWSLVWAALIFSEPITLGNIVGTALIIGGILVIQSE